MSNRVPHTRHLLLRKLMRPRLRRFDLGLAANDGEAPHRPPRPRVR